MPQECKVKKAYVFAGREVGGVPMYGQEVRLIQSSGRGETGGKKCQKVSLKAEGCD